MFRCGMKYPKRQQGHTPLFKKYCIICPQPSYSGANPYISEFLIVSCYSGVNTYLFKCFNVLKTTRLEIPIPKLCSLLLRWYALKHGTVSCSLRYCPMVTNL